MLVMLKAVWLSILEMTPIVHVDYVISWRRWDYKMIIAALSDTHNQHFSRQMQPNYCMHPDAQDIIIHAGDATVRGTMGEIHSFADWVYDICRHVKAFIFVAGNHDWSFQVHSSIALGYFKEIKNFYYLEDSGIEIDGVKFWGSPVTKDYIPDPASKILRRRGSDGWAFGRSEELLANHWKLIPDDTDVLITHSPALGIGDSNSKMSFGSPSLLNRLLEIKPKLHIFGHVHEGRG